MREICGRVPGRQLTVGLCGRPGRRSALHLFVWPGLAPSAALPQTQWLIQYEGQRGGRGDEWMRWGRGEVWCLSLPWSPMALLTIQHPPNYPPVHRHRDKAQALVCWSNMATNLSHSNITPTSLSPLEVRHGQALLAHPLYFYVTPVNRLEDFCLFLLFNVRASGDAAAKAWGQVTLMEKQQQKIPVKLCVK